MATSLPDSRALSRRSLLKSGLVGVGVVAVGGVGLQLRSTRRRDLPAQGLKCLTPTEFAILAAVAARVCPPLGSGAPGADALELARAVDGWLPTQNETVIDGFRIGLGALESALLGALFGERITPFTQLAPEEQDRVLRAWQHSRVGFRRTVFRVFTSLIAHMNFGDPRTWARVGYGGPPSPNQLRTAFSMNLVDLDALRAGAKPRSDAISTSTAQE